MSASHFSYFVDGQKYETESSSITGAMIKSQIPNFDQAYSLWIEGHGKDADRLVQDSEAFSLERHGQGELRFYTVPPASFGSHVTSR
jgi:hypothetical protein